MPEPFTFTIEERDPPNVAVTARLGDKPPMPSSLGGEGGWEEVALPKRSAVLVWKGRGLLRLAVPILFDRFIEGRPVAGDYAKLLKMWRPDSPTEEPPVVQISSPGDIVPYANLEWVVGNPEWGDLRADKGGSRTLQAFTLNLIEYRADERLQTADAARATKTAKQRTYRVERKDLAGGLGGIAERLHIPGGWKALGAAQTPKIVDPRYIHAHQVLVIPTVEKTKLGTVVSWAQPSSGG